MIAVARIMMPKSVVRLSAGRQYMTDELQALCFVAGANSILVKTSTMLDAPASAFLVLRPPHLA
jgi:biotin synthase-like enzyme